MRRTLAVLCFGFSLLVPPPAVFAVGIKETNNCHYLRSVYGIYRTPGTPDAPVLTGDASVKTHGVSRDLDSYYTRFMPQAVANYKAAVDKGSCAPHRVTPDRVPYRAAPYAQDLLEDGTVVTVGPYRSAGWLVNVVSENPQCSPVLSQEEVLSVESVFAPLLKVNQPFHGFSDASVDEMIKVCLQQQVCSIRLSGPGGTNGALADVEPGKTVSGLTATVTCAGAPSDKAVILTVLADANTGGHNHPDSARPPGALNPASGNGPVSFSFTAPTPSGDHTVTARCVDGSCGEDTGKVWVGIKDLVSLSPSPNYALIGETGTHPANHYLIDAAIYRTTILAALYRQTLSRLFPGGDFRLHLNDASLERGGIFDIYDNWKRPHAEHCRGTVIDVRANDAPGAIPGGLRRYFERLARSVGADPLWEIPVDANGNNVLQSRHYHVRLMGSEGLQCAR